MVRGFRVGAKCSGFLSICNFSNFRTFKGLSFRGFRIYDSGFRGLELGLSVPSY